MARLTEFVFTPTRLAVLGVNVIPRVNLGWSAVLSPRFLGGGGSSAGRERGKTASLPVYAAWAAIVAIVFPPMFGYI